MPINTSISTKNALILLTNCISNSCSEYSGDNSARSKVYSSLTANFACTLHSAGNVKSKFVWFNKISQHTLCPTIALYHLNVKFHLQIIFTLFHNDNILLQLISRTNGARFQLFSMPFIYLKSNNTINRISLYFQKTQYIIQYIIFLGYFDIPINIALKLSL